MDGLVQVVSEKPNVPNPPAGPDATVYNTFEVANVEIGDFSNCVHAPTGLIRRVHVEGCPDATIVTDTGLAIPMGKPEKADPNVVDALNKHKYVNILGGSMDYPGREPTGEETKAIERREVVSLSGMALKVMHPDLEGTSFNVCFEMLDGQTLTETAHAHAYHLDHCKHPTHYLHLRFDSGGKRAWIRPPVGNPIEFETADDVYIVLDDTPFGNIFKGVADKGLEKINVSTLNLSRVSGITIGTEGAALIELRAGHYRARYAGGAYVYV